MYRTSDPHLAHYVVFVLSGIATILLPNLVHPSGISPKPIAKFASILVITISGIVLIGWVFDIAIFKSVTPDLGTMKFNTAFGFLLVGISLMLFEEHRNQKVWLIARSLAVVVTLLSLTTLSQYLFGWNAGIDQIFFQDAVRENETTYPGRLAPITAFNFLLLGLALNFLKTRHYWVTHIFTLLAAIVSLIALLGYIYQVESLLKISIYSSAALHTTLAFILACVGIIFARPDQGLVKIFLSNSPGGVMARRLLPMAIGLPIGLGLLRLMGQRAGLYNTEVGLSLMIASYVVTLGAIILWNAGSLYRMDIKRRKAEEALLATQERYRELFENANDIMYIHDLKGDFTSTNLMTERLTGYTNEEALQMNIAQIIAPEYIELARKNLAEKLLERTESSIYLVEIICKDGHRLPVEVSTRLIYEGDKPVAVQGIVRDLSERSRLEDQLRQSQKMESVGRLAGGIAHDFNNLLTAIIGYSQMAMRHLAPDSPAKNDIKEVEKAGKRAAELTGQLLTFSRKQALQPKVIDLNQIVANIERMLHRVIGEDIELSTKLSPDLGLVKADPGQIEQIIMNLAVNARDAMPQAGKLTIETANVEFDETYTQAHLAVTPGPYVMLAFSDTGIGMNKETQARIFEPFFTTKDSGKGTGLGLSTVYGIVKQSGGNLWVYSEKGRGTTFKIYLPRVEEPSKPEESDAQKLDSFSGTGTILLVEDDLTVRQLTRQILEINGYTILEATSAAHALQICEQHEGKIHLIITDVIMPDMSGRELAQQVRQLGNEAKVLYMSGYTDNSIVHHGILDADTPFLQKPFTSDSLTRKVREVISSV
jgi:two-component system, cell cycle sensor histidine kinase and response regulator CckA